MEVNQHRTRRLCLSLDPYNKNLPSSGHLLRQKNYRIFNDSARLQIAKFSFNTDAAKLWNSAPSEISSAKILSIAKKAIRAYAKSLPI